jgi:hypothetical protein
MTTRNFAVSHLSEDDLDEILLDIAPPAATAHLAACESCARRFTAFQTQLQAQMSAFNQASLAWSEARSNTISRDLTHHKATPRITLPAAWSAAAALVLAATFGLHAGLDRAPGAQDATHAAAVRAAGLDAASRDSADRDAADRDAVHPEHDQYELAADNAMLLSIDSEMGTPQPGQFGLYQKTKAPVAPQQSDDAVQVRD